MHLMAAYAKHATRVRKCLVGSSAGQFEIVDNVDIPTTLAPDMMLCKVAAIALNPADAKISDFSPAPGSIVGFDFAGEVVRVGSGVKRFELGDRVFCVAWGQNPADKTMGCFSEYALAKEDHSCKIPNWMSFEQASTFGVAVATVGCSISCYLDLPLPDTPLTETKSCVVLVSGGATATGVVATQFLHLAGLSPIVTCSPPNTALLKSLGAVETFDYHSPACGMEINHYTKGNLAHVLDCISTAETMSMCYEAIGTSGGRYVALDPISTHVKYSRRDVLADWIVAVTVFGAPVKFGGVYGRPVMPRHRALASRLFVMVERLVEQGLLKAPPFKVRSGGLEAVATGIDDVRKGRVKGGKLVYSLP
ncbi:Enoyl reductase LovC [Cytospora mali]|uniref:Enoyl reductase LovC n=1 Tax=Cytospora mali TaxID=578113 RepID=A0A194VK58_CYTMA|nr:Enoyl reductase LovC [Valsa mali]